MSPVERTDLEEYLRLALADPCAFSRLSAGMNLRSYQQEVAAAVIDSVLRQKGLSFVVMFPRQSGKNELQAHLEAYLLTLLSRSDCEMVKISPTWKPQSQNAMRRLERVLKKGLVTQTLWEKESGYIYRVGRATIYFFYGEQQANIVGATASTLLEVDEAQDVSIDKYDKDIAPMAASTNATRVFWGTAVEGQSLSAGSAIQGLFHSRKFWAGLAGLIVILLRAALPDLPLEDEQLTAIIITLSAYIFGTGAQDGLANLGGYWLESDKENSHA